MDYREEALAMNSESSPFRADRPLFGAIANLTRPVPYPEGTVLFRQGSECFGLFVLRSGLVVLEMACENGEVCASFVADDRSLLGLSALLSGERYSLSALARRDSVVGFVKRDDFLARMSSNPTLSLKALQVMAAETRAARAALVEALERQRRR